MEVRLSWGLPAFLLALSLAVAEFCDHGSYWEASLPGLELPPVFLTEFPPIVSYSGGVQERLLSLIARNLTRLVRSSCPHTPLNQSIH